MKRDRPHCSSATLQRRAMLLVSLCVVASSSLVPEHDAPDAAEELPPPRLHLCLDGVDVEDGDAANPIMVPAHAAVLLEYETLSFDPASCGQLALLVLVDGAFHYKMQPVQPTGEVVFPHAFGAESHTLSVSILEAASGTTLYSAAMSAHPNPSPTLSHTARACAQVSLSPRRTSRSPPQLPPRIPPPLPPARPRRRHTGRCAGSSPAKMLENAL